MSASADILAPHPDALHQEETPLDHRTTFRYFAYGSNLWTPRMVERCPSARVVEVAHLVGWRRVYDKPSIDGSAKLNLRPDPEGLVPGVVYDIEHAERERLDAAEVFDDCRVRVIRAVGVLDRLVQRRLLLCRERRWRRRRPGAVVVAARRDRTCGRDWVPSCCSSRWAR